MSEADKKTNTIEIKIGGMHCAMCVKAVENSLRKVPGIREFTVNLASEGATIVYEDGQVGSQEMKKAVEAAGYQYLGPAQDAGEKEAQMRVQELRTRRQRILLGFATGLPLMAAMLLMKHPVFLWRLAMLVFSLPGIIFLCLPIFRLAGLSLRNRMLNMDVMYSLGSSPPPRACLPPAWRPPSPCCPTTSSSMTRSCCWPPF